MIRRLLFILFLYILLVWIVATLLWYTDPGKLFRQGLLWTAVGVAALLLWLILERVIASWRVRRAERAARPQTVAVGQSKQVHDDDATLSSLLSEADQRLAQAPGSPGEKRLRALELPTYLIVGPERTGKTTLMHNSGIEPSLLAGQVTGGAPTRVANLWFAQQSLFLEVSGRVFNSEPARFAEFLSGLQPRVKGSGWRRWFQSASASVPLRGVVVVFDVMKFAGTPEPSELDRSAQQIRERLFAMAGAMGMELPVYVVFTKADGLKYFGDYFARLAETEAGQVFGVLTSDRPQGASQEGVWAEAETKRLNQYFQSLYVRLSDRRLLALTQESKPAPKPAIYEFPREFKRIRTPLVQFLVDTFRPDPFKSGPRLRGFFFTAIRKVERGASQPSEPKSVYQSSGAQSSEATQIFSSEMSPGGSVFRKSDSERGSRQVIDQWLFVTDLFRRVLNLDRPIVQRTAGPSKLEQYHRIAVGAAALLAFVFGLAWTISWVLNRQLQGRVGTAVADVQRSSVDLSSNSLAALDRLRIQLLDLEKGDSLNLHWGLYTGKSLREIARRAYFERLRRVSLGDIDQTLVSQLEQSSNQNRTDGPGPTYERLKTYRTITTLACPVDAPLISKVLRETTEQTFPRLGEDQAALLNVQLNYYVSQLDKRENLPVKFDENSDAETKARAYLRQSSGQEQQLLALLADVDQRIKPLSVADYAENYTAVLTGPAQFRGAFTKNGLAIFEDLADKGKFGSGQESCVMGELAGFSQHAMDAETREQIKWLYYRRYADAWRDFLGSFKVISYSSTRDAARRLDVLAGTASPLLNIVKLVAINTNFPQPKPGESTLEKGAKKIGLGGFVQAKTKAEAAGGQLESLVPGGARRMTKADLGKLFQPMQFTTPDPGLLVNENDGEYVKSLRALQQSLDSLANASTTDRATIIPQAHASATQAHTSRNALADKFYDVGNEGLNRLLADLLEQPIRLAEAVIPANPILASGGNKNGALRQFCTQMTPILSKYPFSPFSQTEATLIDVANAFGPNGLVSKYIQTSASDLAVRKGNEWVQNPALQGMKTAPELLSFLSRSQELTNVFFPDGSMMQPKLKYVLRPVPGQPIGIKLVLDGIELNSQSPLQRTFYWPAAAGAKPGAEGTVEGGALTTGFGLFDGLWGVFRLFQSADERALGTHLVQWSEIRGRGGAQRQKLDPPAKVEFVELPGNVDLFNPMFFRELQCPKRAVVVE